MCDCLSSIRADVLKLTLVFLASSRCLCLAWTIFLAAWTSAWHALFAEFPDDDRRLLGWPGRFADVAQHAVNFYSTGDEVLELNTDNDLNVLTGASDGLGHLSWHKQEIFKGSAQLTSGLGGTDWSGWGFKKVYLPAAMFPVQVVKYTAAEAALRTEAQLRADPVFNPRPANVTNSVLPLLTRAAHLTQGIPALAPPTGGASLAHVLGDADAFDLNSSDLSSSGVLRPNGWPHRSTYSGRWLHSDMKDVAFYFNYALFEKVIEKGGLR